MQYRIWHLAVVCYLVGTISVVVTIVVLWGNASKKLDEQKEEAAKALELYTRSFILAALREVDLVLWTACGFVQAMAGGIPMHNGTLSERMVLLDADKLNFTLGEALKYRRFVRAVELCPSGVVAQAYPDLTVPEHAIGSDLRTLSPTYEERIAAALTRRDVASNQIFYEVFPKNGTVHIVVYLPVFLNASYSLSTWWGTVHASFDTTSAAQVFTNESRSLVSASFGWVLFMYNAQHKKEIIGNSSADAVSAVDNSEFNLTAALSLDPWDGDPIFLSLVPNDGWRKELGVTTITLIVVLAALGCTIVTVGVHCIVLIILAPRNVNLHAPRDPPVAIALIDIEKSQELWSNEPAQMSVVLASYAAIVRSAIKDHHAYEVRLTGDGFVIACRSITELVDLCVQIHEAVHQTMWPEDVLLIQQAESTHTSDGYLMVRMTAHHAKKVDISFDGQHYDYSGSDLTYLSRLHVFAVPGHVCVSEEVREGEESESPFGASKHIFRLLAQVKVRGLRQQRNVYSAYCKTENPAIATEGDAPLESVVNVANLQVPSSQGATSDANGDQQHDLPSFGSSGGLHDSTCNGAATSDTPSVVTVPKIAACFPLVSGIEAIYQQQQLHARNQMAPISQAAPIVGLCHASFEQLFAVLQPEEREGTFLHLSNALGLPKPNADFVKHLAVRSAVLLLNKMLHPRNLLLATADVSCSPDGGRTTLPPSAVAEKGPAYSPSNGTLLHALAVPVEPAPSEPTSCPMPHFEASAT